MISRRNEQEKTHFRTERIYSVNGQWRFMTREQKDMGPFVSRREAETELLRYIREMESTVDMDAAPAKKDDDVWSRNFGH